MGTGAFLPLLGPFATVSAFGTVFAASIFDSTGSFDTAWQVFLIEIVPAGIIIMWLQAKPGEAKPAAQALPAASE